ncbi:MAG: hypothetical protein ACE5EX_11715 [Phycisphaerae bacterium]
MDHRPILKTGSMSDAAAPAPAEPVLVEQAVFTSVRSPTGEGYRLIAASKGLRPDERTEITRRAPSHGSLDEADGAAAGLLAFPLPAGRVCVARCRHAGREQTARGGQRVYSHFVVLDAQADLAFGCDPVRVYGALSAAIGETPDLSPPPMLELLALSPQHRSACSPFEVAAGTGVGGLHADSGCRRSASAPAGGFGQGIEVALGLVLALLRNERIVATGGEAGIDLLATVTACLPLPRRRGLAVSVGLKYAPVRQTRLCLLARNTPETQRAIRGQSIRHVDLDAAPERPPSDYDPWLAWLGRRLSAGRIAEVERLTAAIEKDASPRRLARFAALCDDLDRVETADEQALRRLSALCASRQPTGALEARLVRQLREAVERRASRLREQTDAATVSGASAAGGAVLIRSAPPLGESNGTG